MSIGHRRFRAGIYWYVDIGTTGRSDPRYVKQTNPNATDGNWWCSLDQIDGDEVIRGGKPEYRMRAVIGYSTRVDWMASLVADMLFLHRFYRDPSPWRNLRRIFASVQRDYPRARRLGHLLIMRD